MSQPNRAGRRKSPIGRDACLQADAHVTVVIPTLDEGRRIGALLAVLAGAPALVARIVVSDGGSVDDTVSIARRHGAEVVTGRPGRGGQLRRGAERIADGWIWLLHADSELPPGWAESLRDTLARADPARAYYGRLRFASGDIRARIVERLAGWRCRVFRLPYGDQSLLIHARLLAALGGVPDLKLMEDVALARRLGRRLALMDLVIGTSARTYQRDGWFRRAAGNLIRLALFLAGRDPARLAKTYRR